MEWKLPNSGRGGRGSFRNQEKTAFDRSIKTLIDFLDLLQPGWQLIQILVMSGLVLYAVYSLVQRFDALLGLFVGCLLSNMAIVTVWFLFALQTKWGLELLPTSVRQVLCLTIQLGYPFEILLWSLFAFLLIRRNRAETNEERKG